VRKRISLALITAALVLSGCSGTQFGAAAVVDGEKISVATVEASVTGVMNQRRATGEQDTGTVRSGQDARDQMRFHIIAVSVRQLAEARGITISPGEKNEVRQQLIQSVGGDEGLLIALTQNAIAKADLDRYVESVIYQQKLGRQLLPGDTPEVEAQRRDLVQAELAKKFRSAKISVNPRFGVFDAQSGLLLNRDNTNGAVILPTE
jgi:hypothetical protein